MCLACEEMDLYFAYLAQVEAAKKSAAGSASNGEPAKEPQSAPSDAPAAPLQNAFLCEDPTAQ
jgi:hypothetical protein